MIEKNIGTKSTQYKLRDWLFSRQRYWGEPIPIIHKENGDIISIPENDLPLILPKVEKYKPADSGESPLANISKWVITPEGKRETNTMPQWAGSCWYYLRYIDPTNDNKPWDKEKEQYWMPVDLYVGGTEHAVLHLLYSRFWHHVLHDLGLVSTREPYKKLFNQGMIRGEDGQKMSKSRGNVINPDDVVNKFGADSLRLYEMFMGPLDKSKPWSTKGLHGCHRFLQKVWRLINDNSSKIKDNCSSNETNVLLHKTIKKITEDLNGLRFNTAVSQLMIFTNHLNTLKVLDKNVLNKFLILLNPFAPHIAEELNQKIGFNQITSLDWPVYDKTLVIDQKIIIAAQFNGKKRGTLDVISGLGEDEIMEILRSSGFGDKYLSRGKIIRVIYIPDKIINVIIK